MDFTSVENHGIYPVKLRTRITEFAMAEIYATSVSAHAFLPGSAVVAMIFDQSNPIVRMRNYGMKFRDFQRR